MSVLVVGLSHKSAPVAILERAAVSGDTLTKLLRDVVQAEPVAETFVVSTCNRVEVYADVDRFHAGVTAICELLARHCGVPSHELTQYLYVHYEDRAVSHLLAVAAGLDSMVVGEEQILGQVRSAIKLAAEHGTAGPGARRARPARAAHRQAGQDRDRDRPGRRQPAERRGRARRRPASARCARGEDPLAGRDVLVVGAGSMSALAAATAARSGAASIAVANRTRAHAERLAASVSTATTTGHRAGRTCPPPWPRRTSSSPAPARPGTSSRATWCRPRSRPGRRRGTLVILDLAMPRDVEPAVAGLPGVALIGMDQLSEHATAARDDDVAAVRAILEAELAAYQSAMDAARVAPTVVALRAKAAKVVDAELARLAGRLSADGLSGHALDEIAQTVRRVVDKLLHAPTVRVKELAGSPGGEEYAAALRVLFDLDPRAVEAVTRAAPEQEGSR